MLSSDLIAAPQIREGLMPNVSQEARYQFRTIAVLAAGADVNAAIWSIDMPTFEGRAHP
jgi:hypothetical protein